MKYGRYQIIKEMGRGEMGVVYQAHDPNLDLLVALKVLRHERVTSDAFVGRFLAEGKALGRLDHANIVRVYNVDKDNGTVYIAMEFIEGEPLKEVLQKMQFSSEKIVEFGITIAETLDYAHQKGIIHRDIKPANILIRSDGSLKITDFGIAHIEDPSASIMTQDGDIIGTPAYMSPEQTIGQPVDGRSDLFSLGIILYELCTGTRPFRGENRAATFNAITRDDPPQISKINPAIPRDLSQIIMKCLRKKPNERFDTGKTLADALKGCLKKRKSVEVVVSDAQKKTKRIVFFIFSVLILIGIIGSISYYNKYIKDKSVIRSASLKLESIPVGAQVFVDGMFKGKTPVKLELLLGKHEVRLTFPDYYDWEAQIQLSEEGETPLFVELMQIVEEEE